MTQLHNNIYHYKSIGETLHCHRLFPFLNRKCSPYAAVDPLFRDGMKQCLYTFKFVLPHYLFFKETLRGQSASVMTSQMESKTIGAAGGKLTSAVDVKVAIEVPRDAVPDGTKISMAVTNTENNLFIELHFE